MKKLNVLIFSVLWGGVSAQVGIGTTTPSNDLDVESGDATKTAIEINNTSTGDPKINFQFGVSAPTFSIGIDNSDADKFKIGTSALETNTRFTIDASGNVGIGTTSPSTKLHLDGTFRLVDGNQSNGKVLTSDANGVATWQTASGGSLPAGTSGQTLRHDGTNWVANSNIFNNGTNVGIGTTSPGVKLDVLATSGRAVNANDGTSWISLVPSASTWDFSGLSSPGDMGLFFSVDGSTFSTASNGLVIGPDCAWSANGYAGIKIMENGRVGIGMTPSTNLLEVNGDASKTAAGDWLANSDARLKKDIKQMDSKAVLDKMLALKGITYYWNDTVTGSKRPTQLQYGFTAQNIQEVFPILVEEDNLGYLQTAYGTYDAMYVESMRALQQQIDEQQAIIEAQEREIDALKQNALKVAELENKMNAMLLLLNNKQELTVKQ